MEKTEKKFNKDNNMATTLASSGDTLLVGLHLATDGYVVPGGFVLSFPCPNAPRTEVECVQTTPDPPRVAAASPEERQLYILPSGVATFANACDSMTFILKRKILVLGPLLCETRGVSW